MKDANSAIDQSIVRDAGFSSIFRASPHVREWVDGENMFLSDINQIFLTKFKNNTKSSLFQSRNSFVGRAGKSGGYGKLSQRIQQIFNDCLLIITHILWDHCSVSSAPNNCIIVNSDVDTQIPMLTTLPFDLLTWPNCSERPNLKFKFKIL